MADRYISIELIDGNFWILNLKSVKKVILQGATLLFINKDNTVTIKKEMVLNWSETLESLKTSSKLTIPDDDPCAV